MLPYRVRRLPCFPFLVLAPVSPFYLFWNFSALPILPFYHSRRPFRIFHFTISPILGALPVIRFFHFTAYGIPAFQFYLFYHFDTAGGAFPF